MREILFIADDLGISREANAAIFRAHREGVLHGASLMMGQASSVEAAATARSSPTLRVGWHLHLCDSAPVTAPRWPWGASPFLASLALMGLPAARKLVRLEIREQWRMFLATGLPCDFVNGHHHLHVHPIVLRELAAIIPSTNRPWMRGFNVRAFGNGARLERVLSPLLHRRLGRSGWRTSETLWGLDRLHAMDAQEVARAAATLPPGRHEFVFHPRDRAGDADLAALLRLASLPRAAP